MSRQAENKVMRRTTISRERVLPMPGDVLVRRGELVSPQTVIAKTEVLPGDPYVIDIRHEFRMPNMTAKDVNAAMVKRVGDRVRAGEALARITRGLLGEIIEVKSPVDGVVEFISRTYGRVLLREDPQSASPVVMVPVARQLDVWPATIRMYMRYREGDEVKQGAALADSVGVASVDYSYAPVSGIIEKIDTRTGVVTIVRPARPTLVEAYLTGRVDALIPEYGAMVSCEAGYIQGVFGVGFETYGYLRVISSSPEDTVDEDDLTGELRDQVLVAGAYITLGAVRKAAAAGARGIICGGMDHLDLVGYVGQEIGVGITGQEDVPMTLILMEGFGKLAMRTSVFEALAALAGRQASINGATQIRAGAIRPEIIVPFPGHEAAAEARAPVDEDLRPGQPIRIISDPHFGEMGVVVDLPREAHRVETEANVPVVRVRLPSGEEAIVPRANVEVF